MATPVDEDAARFGVISVSEALAAYAAEIEPLSSEKIALDDALGRTLRAAVASIVDLPPFTQSAMDGYAVAAADLAAVTEGSPVSLAVSFEIAAGADASDGRRLGAGEAARIFTGAPLPPGADAVVRQEDADRDGGRISVRRAIRAGQDVRVRGEELERGGAVAQGGERLGPGRLGALAIAGIAELEVGVRPRVRVLVTGDELVRPGRPLRPGQVYDANRVLAESWLRSRGVVELRVDHVPDDRQATVAALSTACDAADLVITTGGVSVGDHDHVIGGLEAAGGRRVFWKVRQKPGKPLLFAMRDRVPILGIPGNPASVFAVLQVHAARVLDLLEGVASPRPQLETGELAAPVRRSGERDVWLRCSIARAPGGLPKLEPLPAQGSHMLSNLFRCDALAWIPEGEGELQAGEPIRFVYCTASA